MIYDYISAQTIAVIAFALYLQLAHIVAGRLSNDNASDSVFALLALAAAAVAFWLSLQFQDCSNFNGGWPFGYVDPCVQGSFQLGPTLHKYSSFMCLALLSSFSLFGMRLLLAASTKREIHRLVPPTVISLLLAAVLYGYVFGHDGTSCIMPCNDYITGN